MGSFGKRRSRSKKTVELTVRNMTCGHCERRVSEALEAVAGVSSATADHTDDRATVKLERGKRVSYEQLVAALEPTAYEAKRPSASD